MMWVIFVAPRTKFLEDMLFYKILSHLQRSYSFASFFAEIFNPNLCISMSQKYNNNFGESYLC